MSESLSLCIVIPVYNDWSALHILLHEISDHPLRFHSIKIVLVNDGSTQDNPEPSFSNNRLSIETVHLRRNMGHQKAIAIGLAYQASQPPMDVVIVMDADGEDKPEDIPKLLNEYTRYPKSIIFAERKKRKSGFLFTLLYTLYKLTFKILTGEKISFGNFCLIPGESLKTLVYLSEIWNHFSGGIIKSRMSFRTISLNKGKRLVDKSKMGFISLIIHGISSISVHLDVVAVRLLILFSLLIVLALGGVVIVIGIKLLTDLAIPGWASTIGLGLTIIIIQSFFVLLILSFIILSYRTQVSFIPAIQYQHFILKVEKYG